MREIAFPNNAVVHLTGTAGEVQAVTHDGWRNSWVARLSRPTGVNELALRYFRRFETPFEMVGDTRRFRLGDGVWEAESAGPGGEPRLYAFEVQHGDVVWVHSVTLDKRGALERILEALR